MMSKSIRSFVFALSLAVSAFACGGGSKDTPTTVAMSVEAPSAVADMENIIYKVSIETSDGSSVLVEPTLPDHPDAASPYTLTLTQALGVDEAALVFQYLSEEEGLEGLVLAEARQEVSFASNAISATFAAADFDTTAFDEDGDGVNNLDELSLGLDPTLSDSDSDGVDDSIDAFPSLASESADTDGDGIGDASDEDADADGVADSDEVTLGSDPFDADSDNDGVGDGADSCILAVNADQIDTDGDASGDTCDNDDDNDGLSDSDEAITGSSPLAADSDGDGTRDPDDAFPTNALETADAESDGLGDHADSDDDNDGLSDSDEVALGSNPFDADSDDDGIRDGADSCIFEVNADQVDTDQDGVGDTCDDDDDNDGLEDGEELAYGADGWQTGPLVADSDADGVFDSVDTCPLTSNTDQADTDADGDGDACDCQSLATAAVPNPESYNHRALDRPDLRLEDRNCDGLDGSHSADSDRTGIYLKEGNSSTGSDNGNGSLTAPFTSLSDAIALASTEDRDIYIADGEHNTSGLVITSSVRLYGGFGADFASRTLDPSSPGTLFYSDSANIVLSVSGATGGVLQGVGLELRSASVADGTILVLSNANGWALEGNRLSAADGLELDTFTGLHIDASADILISALTISAAAARDADTGIMLRASSALIRNSLVMTGTSEGTTALVVEDGSEVEVLNTTLDGGSHASGHAIGVHLNGATSFAAHNTLIIADEAQATTGILCTGDRAPEIALDHALFYFDATSSALPLYEDCTGSVYTDAAGLEANIDITASDTLLAIGSRSALVDDSDRLVSGAVAIDAGGDFPQDAAESDAGIVLDVDLGDRGDGTPDIGADEF